MTRINEVVEILYFTSIDKGSTNPVAVFIFQVRMIKSCEESDEESDEELHWISNQDMEERQKRITEIRTKCWDFTFL